MIIILDFGSQYTQLILRKVRESGVYCEIFPCTTSLRQIENNLIDKDISSISGFILSGGPSSVFEKGAPGCDEAVLRSGKPVLGICYGMQLMMNKLGGKVVPARKREYGHARLFIKKNAGIFKDLPQKLNVWMSHGDSVVRIPPHFINVARTKNTFQAAVCDQHRKIWGVQFHPEVKHTEFGDRILRNFLFEVCKARADWTMKDFIRTEVKRIRTVVKGNKVVLGLSGGVDSSVAAALLHKAIGRKLYCIFVDNGLLRYNEFERVMNVFRKLGNGQFNLIGVNAGKEFLQKLKGVLDPERKRKLIGRTFIKIFEREAVKIKDAEFLGQGTLYPDFIESVSVKGPSAVIKTHHNVGGLPKRMKLKLIEPLKYLFKDEVRVLGKELRLPDAIVYRQPFPGPGLAIRIIGEVTEERLEKLKQADRIVEEEILNAGLYRKLWQSFAVLLPIKSVGVMGDKRTYENVIALRIVESVDAMTADWSKIPYDILGRISNRIINEVQGINRVVYDISSKPPSTIEWE
ncbi:MAG: glutamine-hydrolyzing GMP synthase [bacterium]|nr:glutamine-hydrolyzing GMP synthase [bacterium]